MKKNRLTIKIVILSLITMFLSACWNYREIESLAIATALAIDKTDDKFVLHIEIASPSSEKGDAKVKSVILKSEGITMFDAVREVISKTGKKVFWSHLKVIILGQEVFDRNIADTLDWIVRDAETREDAWILASQNENAATILFSKPDMESLISFQLDETLRTQRASARFPSTPIWKYLEEITVDATASALPAVRTIDEEDKKIPIVEGAAVIKKDKLVGWITPEEVKSLLWIRDELKGGLYMAEDALGKNKHVSLEIFNSKTKLRPKVKDGELVMEIYVNPTVEIAEVAGYTDITTEEGLKKFKKYTENQIKSKIEKLITKLQKELKTDILGFASKTKTTLPRLWREVEKNWDEVFTELSVEVNVELNIRGTLTAIKPVRISD